MSETIDARGLSCPQPVILALNAMNKKKSGEMTILVDTDTAKENVTRATLAQGWQVAGILGREDGYEILVKKED